MTTTDRGFRQDIADAVLILPVAATFGLTFTELAASWPGDASTPIPSVLFRPIPSRPWPTSPESQRGSRCSRPAARPPRWTTSSSSSPRPVATSSLPALASFAPAPPLRSPRSTSSSYAVGLRRFAPPHSSPCATSSTVRARRTLPDGPRRTQRSPIQAPSRLDRGTKQAGWRDDRAPSATQRRPALSTQDDPWAWTSAGRPAQRHHVRRGRTARTPIGHRAPPYRAPTLSLSPARAPAADR
jgi:hypothetical protein